MTSVPFAPLQLDPELRDAAERVLRDGETLDGFVEQSVRERIEQRLAQEAFIARGLAARDEARSSGDYFDRQTVTASLNAILERKRQGL